MTDQITRRTLPEFGNAKWDAIMNAVGKCTACGKPIDTIAVRVKGTQDLYHRNCAQERVKI